MQLPPRSGRAAIVGRPNVGKSTLLNALLGQKLAIAAPKPGTTRSTLLGVFSQKEPPTQIAFVDTPGLHRPRNALGRALVEDAKAGFDGADVILMVTDVGENGVHPESFLRGGDTEVLELVRAAKTPAVLVINKVDRLKNKTQLLPVLEQALKLYPFAAVVPLSARRNENVDALITAIREHLHDGLAYDPEQLTDKPERFFASELIREAVLNHTREEVPHGIAVLIEKFEEDPKIYRVAATIVVSKNAHKGIVIGKGGSLLKQIGTDARVEMEALYGRKVFLELWVKVVDGWTEDPNKVQSFVRDALGEELMAKRRKTQLAVEVKRGVRSTLGARGSTATADGSAEQEHEVERERGGVGQRPIVAIVGRPNVGKSSLFNRLAGAPIALVEDRPGVTRDRLYAESTALNRPFVLIDTGGFDPESDDPLKQSIAAQVIIALEEADIVICVLDATQGPLPADREAVALLRRSKIPVLYVANKCDNHKIAQDATELYKLGIDALRPVSALHGHGIGDLEEEMVGHFPDDVEEDEYAGEQTAKLDRIAIVGRPNAGKSSLVNRILGEVRQIVDDRPGTTIDSVDTRLEYEGEPLVLIDTAGIRRKRSVDRGLEALAVMQAVRAVERSDVAVLMIDAHEGPSEQDAKIAGLCIERGRGLVIALNKGDLLDDETRKKAFDTARDLFNFAPWAELHLVSVKEGRGVKKLMATVLRVAAAHKKRVTTGEVNRFFEDVLSHHPPPAQDGRSVRLYYVTQVSSSPPTFIITTNHPERVHFSYKRYVTNQLREHFGFHGTPVRVFYRPKNKEDR